MSPPRSAAALPAAPWGGRGEGASEREHVGLAHRPYTSYAPHAFRASPPPPSHPSYLPLVPLLARRNLTDNSLSGSLPTQLGALTALTRM